VNGMTDSWRLSPRVTMSLSSPRIIGIVNVTPDSFSDGGEIRSPDDAAAAALRLINEGASMIDVGGESTRPGAASVYADEQIRRVLPAIAAIRTASDVPISIDTTQSAVAEAALDAGATVINDVSAGLDDPDMFACACRRGCGMILMHRRTSPDKDSYSDRYAEPPAYDDVVKCVMDFLRDRVDAAVDAGLEGKAIVIDPGLGFGKTVEQNEEIIARIDALAELGLPVLCAASRKSFIGALTGETVPSRRVIGSVAVALMMYSRGVRLFRVHDVAAHHQALTVAETIWKSRVLAEEKQGIA